MSPALFDTYINTLASDIVSTGIGAMYGNDTIGALLYADDVVLLADSSEYLQKLLTTLDSWCNKWRMSLSSTKTSVLIFRNSKVEQPASMCLHSSRLILTNI